MIAVSLFIVVMIAGITALLNANLLHKKSQNARGIMDNLSFIMEDISRNLRTGQNYHCVRDDNGGLSGFGTALSGQDCWGVAFKDQDGNQWVYYINTSNGALGTPGIYKSSNGGTNYVKLSPDEITITGFSGGVQVSGFSVLGAEPPPGDQQQPLVIINLVGTALLNNAPTPFFLQTSVSQRLIDVGT